jgi:hypothetical protein
MINTLAQQLHLERVAAATADQAAVDRMWAPWVANRMDLRQGAVNRAAIAYGWAFILVLPGEPTPVLAPCSPRECQALYADPATDSWPEWFMVRKTDPKGATNYLVADSETVWRARRDPVGGRIEWGAGQAHGLGFTPAVRLCNELDLEGRALGEVEPLIPVAARITKTMYDRLQAQHFNSWKITFIQKLDESLTPEEVERIKVMLKNNTILTLAGEGEFGSLPETALAPFIEAHRADLEDFAALSQTPVTAYGRLVNVSAEGLVEARASMRAKVEDK